MDARGDKMKQISITKSRKNSGDHSWQHWQFLGNFFPFWKRAIPKLPWLANPHPQKGIATSLPQHLTPALLKPAAVSPAARFAQVSHSPTGKACCLWSTSCPKLGPKRPPAAFLTLHKTMWWEEDLWSCQDGTGQPPAGRAHGLSPGSLRRQRQQHYSGEISSVCET